MDIPAPRELFDFRGTTVIVTGASSGIGVGVCQAASRRPALTLSWPTAPTNAALTRW